MVPFRTTIYLFLIKRKVKIFEGKNQQNKWSTDIPNLRGPNRSLDYDRGRLRHGDWATCFLRRPQNFLFVQTEPAAQKGRPIPKLRCLRHSRDRRRQCDLIVIEHPTPSKARSSTRTRCFHTMTDRAAHEANQAILSDPHHRHVHFWRSWSSLMRAFFWSTAHPGTVKEGDNRFDRNPKKFIAWDPKKLGTYLRQIQNSQTKKEDRTKFKRACGSPGLGQEQVQEFHFCLNDTWKRKLNQWSWANVAALRPILPVVLPSVIELIQRELKQKIALDHHEELYENNHDD